MEAEKLIEALHTVEKLKRTMRHCYTSDDRKESVAEHCWRVALMAYWMEDEFPEVDINKVIKMCLIHDLGEFRVLKRQRPMKKQRKICFISG